MARSTKKGYFVDPHLIDKIKDCHKTGSRKSIRTWSRRSTITPEFVGLNFEIHNGKTFSSFHATESTVGHKLGEFAPTRSFKGHSPHTQKAVK